MAELVRLKVNRKRLFELTRQLAGRGQLVLESETTALFFCNFEREFALELLEARPSALGDAELWAQLKQLHLLEKNFENEKEINMIQERIQRNVERNNYSLETERVLFYFFLSFLFQRYNNIKEATIGIVHSIIVKSSDLLDTTLALCQEDFTLAYFSKGEFFGVAREEGVLELAQFKNFALRTVWAEEIGSPQLKRRIFSALRMFLLEKSSENSKILILNFLKTNSAFLTPEELCEVINFILVERYNDLKIVIDVVLKYEPNLSKELRANVANLTSEKNITNILFETEALSVDEALFMDRYFKNILFNLYFSKNKKKQMRNSKKNYVLSLLHALLGRDPAAVFYLFHNNLKQYLRNKEKNVHNVAKFADFCYFFVKHFKLMVQKFSRAFTDKVVGLYLETCGIDSLKAARVNLFKAVLLCFEYFAHDELGRHIPRIVRSLGQNNEKFITVLAKNELYKPVFLRKPAYLTRQLEKKTFVPLLQNLITLQNNVTEAQQSRIETQLAKTEFTGRDALIGRLKEADHPYSLLGLQVVQANLKAVVSRLLGVLKRNFSQSSQTVLRILSCIIENCRVEDEETAYQVIQILRLFLLKKVKESDDRKEDKNQLKLEILRTIARLMHNDIDFDRVMEDLVLKVLVHSGDPDVLEQVAAILEVFSVKPGSHFKDPVVAHWAQAVRNIENRNRHDTIFDFLDYLASEQHSQVSQRIQLANFVVMLKLLTINNYGVKIKVYELLEKGYRPAFDPIFFAHLRALVGQVSNFDNLKYLLMVMQLTAGDGVDAQFLKALFPKEDLDSLFSIKNDRKAKGLQQFLAKLVARDGEGASKAAYNQIYQVFEKYVDFVVKAGAEDEAVSDRLIDILIHLNNKFSMKKKLDKLA